MSMKKPSAPVKTAAAKAVDNTLTGQNVLAQTIHSETYTGPIPHPDILKKYDDVKSGLAERIVKMAEREQEYRIDTTRREEEQKEKVIDIAAKESDQFIKAQKWGQWIGAAISGSCIIIPLVLALLGVRMGNCHSLSRGSDCFTDSGFYAAQRHRAVVC